MSNQIDYDQLLKIFDLSNRNNWKSEISPYILEVDMNDRQTLINDNFESWFSFVPEELDPNYKWDYNIGDLVTDGIDIMRIELLPILDARCKDFKPESIEVFGNRYYITRIDKNGNDKEKDDPVPNLHRSVHSNQIHLATKEEIEQIFSKE